MNKISEIPEQTPIAEKPTVEMPADPWRCGACGSLRVSCQVWVDSNTYEVQPMAEDKDDLWCDDCVLSQSKSALEANKLFHTGNFFASFIAHFGRPMPFTTLNAVFLITFLIFFFADGLEPSPPPLGVK